MVRLSEEQRRIVTFPLNDAHLLVVAAPGSGKTLTIVRRIEHLLGTGALSSDQILAMTFTRKAAEELRDRLGVPDVWAGTFHAVCADLLREHGAAIGLRSAPRIVDERRQSDLLERAVHLAGFVLPEREFGFLREVKQRISRRKCGGLDQAPRQAGDKLDDEIVGLVDRAYCDLLEEAGALDFDDLIVTAIRLLAEVQPTADAMHGRLRAVFVDEFHDVSPEQYELLRRLAPPRAPGRQVMAVADPDQAIFGFRGASAPRMLTQLRRDYRPVRHGLTTNFRSSESIVRAAQHLRAGRIPAEITVVPGTDGPGYLVACLQYPDEEREAEALAKLVERARATGAYGYGDIAILYTRHKRANAAEGALIRHRIPVWRVEPGRFFAEPEVQEALRYLELVATLHDSCLAPALNWPRVLVDEVSMVHLRRVAASEGVSLCELARRIDDFAERISPLTRAAVRDFLATVDTALAPLIDEPIDRIVERMLAVLRTRRSPIPRAERADLHGVLDFLAGPLTESVEMLAAAVGAGRPIVLLHGGDGDGVAAALILERALGHYLGTGCTVGGIDAVPAAGAFVVRLDGHRPATADGCGLGVRRLRSYAYGVGTQAWRLGQMLLMRFETLADGRFVVFDLETGSKHPSQAEVLEVAAQPIERASLASGAYASLVRPSGPAAIASAARDRHHIGWPMVRDAPAIGNVLPQLLAALADDVLIGHNIEDFDYPILRRLVRGLGLPAPAHALIDTYKMARRLLSDEPGWGLEHLAQRLEPAVSQEHRALPDARLNARVFLDLLLPTQRREQELDTLTEALPLVALGIAAAGVPLEAENLLLARAGERAAAMGQGDELRARWAAAVGPDGARRGETWLASISAGAPADDAAWERLETRWREVVAAYRRTAADHGLHAFLTYAGLAEAVDYVPAVDGAEAGDDGDEPDPRRMPLSERVAMMTVHAAKGKEWPVVFLIGADDDELPRWFADDEAEERRVLYVAMTRAKRRLCILWAVETSGRSRELSRFLRALPADVIDRRP